MGDVGLMGESTFRSLCAQTDLIANSSEVDKTGWDFIVEFPFHTQTTPLGMHIAAFECKVQVKASNGKNRFSQVRLSNLRRMCTSPYPCFFVFIEYENKDDPQSIFVRHVDNDLITKVLKKIHEIEQNTESKDLNKLKMRITYDRSHQIEHLNGHNLKEAFLKYIGNCINTYASEKRRHLQSTGFENGMYKINFSTTTLLEYEKIARALVGSKEIGINVENIVVAESRFGITSNSNISPENEATIYISNVTPSATGTMQIITDELTPALNFNVKIFIHPLFMNQEKNNKLIRIENEHFEFIINVATYDLQFNLNLKENEEIEIKHLFKIYQLLKIIGEKEGFFKLAIITENLGPLSWDIDSGFIEENFNVELELIEKSISIISEFKFMEEIKIRIDEPLNMESINQFYWMLHSPVEDFSVTFRKSQLDIAYISLIKTKIGNYIFGAFHVILFKPEKSEDILFKGYKKIIEKKIVRKIGDTVPKEVMLRELESIENKYNKNYYVTTNILNREDEKKENPA